MPNHMVPRVFVSYSHDSAAHKDHVREFAAFLRARHGIDVRMDQWDDDRRRDWSLWAMEQLRERDFILVIASPAYKRRADGMAPPDEGRGAQFEAAMIRDSLTENLREEVERILPVVLPGGSARDIPMFLNPHSTTRFEIAELSDHGVADLLAAITGHARYPMPQRGDWRPTGTDERSPVPLANGPLWISRSPGVSAQTAVLNGMRYEDSIVFRPSSPPAEARGFVEIDLGGAYQRMHSVVGILDDATEPFQVGHFRVYLDGTPRCEITSAFAQPASVEVDVAGGSRLRLEMYRAAAAVSPFHPRAASVGRLPELAWGNPTLE